MTVVPFAPFRFSPADLAEFYEIAVPKCTQGLWAGVMRQTGGDYDRLMVSLKGVARPVFSFERGQDGRYRLFYHDRLERRLIGLGDSAAECLVIWRTRRERIGARRRHVERAV
jgi:hypothetical protein